ncbi:MAG: NUDIX domain-containing protein, partial [Clostridia bacterium]|nr:NUDIX domain-containing protein [Clostridia bacterium]
EVALWIIDKENKRVLLQRRSPNKKLNPNKLALCAGHVVGNETIEEALAKESLEELGLYLNKYKVGKLAVIKREEPSNYCFSHHFYIFENKPANCYKIQEEELSEVLYVDYEVFKQMMKEENDQVAYKWHTGEYDKLFKELDKIMK